MLAWVRNSLMASLWVTVSAIPAFTSSSPVSAQELRFDRLWPTLQQPWYFNEPQGIAVEQDGGLIVVDGLNSRVQKYTSNGQLLTEWGTPGDGPGEFEKPVGVAVDSQNNVYVTDTFNHRVQVFGPDGSYLRMFGEIGSGPGQFNGPEGIVIDSADRIFIADPPNFRIAVFESDGTFLNAWGNFGTGNEQFRSPKGLALSPENTLLVTDSILHRVQQFTLDGTFINTWGTQGAAEGQFDKPVGIAVTPDGMVLVADENNRRIQQFDLDGAFLGIYDTNDKFVRGITAPNSLALHPDGSLYATARVGSRILKFSTRKKFLNEWSSKSTLPGHFDIPWGVTVAPSGEIYATDSFNFRVQRFSAEGRFIDQWGEEGTGDGTFQTVYGIAASPEGNLYVTDYGRSNVQVFSPEGEFLFGFGENGADDGQFRGCSGIAISTMGDVFVADAGNNRIQQFTGAGEFVRSIGSVGTDDGQLRNPFGVTVDSEGFVYVADTRNGRVQKFAATGEFLLGWGEEGDQPGQLQDPSGITVDRENRIYVADSKNHRIQIYSPLGQLLGSFGDRGTNPGQLFRPETLSLSPDGIAYVVDSFNSRIQRFIAYEPVLNKAIVVAGGHADGDAGVLRAAEMCSNVAYRALLQQGYSKDTIYLLRSRTDVDLDQNGLFDDVDATTTGSNLEDAIVDWAADATNLVLYLVGPGEPDGFRINEADLISGPELDGWLDTLQQTLKGTVLTLYDGNFAGAFLPPLARNGTQNRITLASAASGESAYFVADGTISYSNLFWVETFNGGTLEDAAARASTNLSGTAKYQVPQIDGNGNGTPNEPEDEQFLKELQVFFETLNENRPPEVGIVEQIPILGADTDTAILNLDGVLDDEGIVSLVRGIITPPGFTTTTGTASVTQLPFVDFFAGDDNAFQATFDGFTESGAYTIDIYALDANLNVSDIEQTVVWKSTVSTGLVCAVVDQATRSPLTSARIQLIKSGESVATLRSTDNGLYVLPTIQEGDYVIEVTLDGYATESRPVTINAIDLASENFELRVLQTGALRASRTSLDFGPVPVNETRDLTLSLSNAGTTALAGALSVAPPFQVMGPSDYHVDPAASYTMTIRFTPSEARAYDDSLQITEGGGLTISLRGTGTAPDASTMDCSGEGLSHPRAFTIQRGDLLTIALLALLLLSAPRWSRKCTHV